MSAPAKPARTRRGSPMRNLRDLSGYLIPNAPSLPSGGAAYLVPSSLNSDFFLVIAAAERGWDHVSISHPARYAAWEEIVHIRRLFFKATETVLQFHFPDTHPMNPPPYYLHLWRPIGAIALPFGVPHAQPA